MNCKLLLLKAYLMYVLIILPNTVTAQTSSSTINLGTVSNYVLFSGIGAVSNAGTSTFTGDIGSNVGAITGFDAPTVVNGSFESANGNTATAKDDLQKLYDQLQQSTITDASHALILGVGEEIKPGVYGFGGAVSISGSLTLNANGDPNAKFIFLIGGAFSGEANANVVLTNGANSSNIYWVTTGGSIAIPAGVTMKGTLLAHSGAVSMAAGGDLQGRLLSLSSAVSFGPGKANQASSGSAPIFTAPVELISFTGACVNSKVLFHWTTASEINNKSFTVEQSEDSKIWLPAGIVSGAGNSATTLNYSFTDAKPIPLTGYYRLKQTDIDSKFKYSKIIIVKSCATDQSPVLVVYPNPSTGIFNMQYKGGSSQAIITSVVKDLSGKMVYSSNIAQTSINLSNKPAGIYVLQIMADAKIYRTKIIIEK